MTTLDPTRITSYGMGRRGLEEHCLFWVLVAGKTAEVVAAQTARLLATLRTETGKHAATPFTLLRAYREAGESIPLLLNRHGIGCHTLKGEALTRLLDANFDLSTCSLADLVSIRGIGLKTAACFLLHTRKDWELAGLDTHILAELRSLGHEAPKTTPQNLKVYEKWAAVVRQLAREAGLTPAEYDLVVWRKRHRAVDKDKLNARLDTKHGTPRRPVRGT